MTLRTEEPGEGHSRYEAGENQERDNKVTVTTTDGRSTSTTTTTTTTARSRVPSHQLGQSQQQPHFGRIREVLQQHPTTTAPLPQPSCPIQLDHDGVPPTPLVRLPILLSASARSNSSPPQHAFDASRMNPAHMHQYQQAGQPNTQYASHSRPSSSGNGSVGHHRAPSDGSGQSQQAVNASNAQRSGGGPMGQMERSSYGPRALSIDTGNADGRRGEETSASQRGPSESSAMMATVGHFGTPRNLAISPKDMMSFQTFPPVRTPKHGPATTAYPGSRNAPTLDHPSTTTYSFGPTLGPYANHPANQRQRNASATVNTFTPMQYSPFHHQTNYAGQMTAQSAWATSLQPQDQTNPDSRNSSLSSTEGRAYRQDSMSMGTAQAQVGSSARGFGMAPRPVGYNPGMARSDVAALLPPIRPPMEQRAEPTTAGPSPVTISRNRERQADSRSDDPVRSVDGIIAFAKQEDSSPEPIAIDREAGDKVDHRKRKRNRTIQSCLPCHQNKRKCDRKRPCSRCTALSLTGSCVYEVDVARDPNDPEQADNDHLRGRIAELEQVVRELRAKATRSTAAASAKQEEVPAAKRRKVEEPTNEESSASVTQEVPSARSGTAHQPGNSTALSAGHVVHNARQSNLPGEEMVGDVHGRKAYVGEPGGRDLLRKLAALGGGPGSVPEEAAFTGVFPDMRSTFPFTTIWSHENFSTEIIGLLPTLAQSEVLLMAFEEEIAMFFSAWHLPTLRSEFQSFFRLPDEAKMTTPLGSLSTYLMICALGILVRASELEIVGEQPRPDTGVENVTTSRLQSELYLSGSYHALRLCSFLSSPTIATIQTQIMISIFLFNSERASDVWPVLGSLIRQALAIGLNIDPVRHDPQMSLKEAEIRRRIWWTIAGLDSLICLSLGRPHAITYWSTQLPQDRPDDALIEGQGTASDMFPPSNVLMNEATSASYHTAYFALTIPSMEILERTFQRERRYCRSGTRGWFQAPLTDQTGPEAVQLGAANYENAIALDTDIVEWYRTIPRGIFFDASVDRAEYLLATRSKGRINQTLALNVKTNMIRLILHRSYLRANPATNPRSSEVCLDAAHTILAAYQMMHATRSSIAWSWWTMSLRSFHAAAVCAFLAARQPDLAIAEQCLADIRGALNIFQGRVSSWSKAHPVQGHLIHGLLAFETLASTAIERSHAARERDTNRSSTSSSSRINRQLQTEDGTYRDLSTISAFPGSAASAALPATPSTGKSHLGGDLESTEAILAQTSYPALASGDQLGRPLTAVKTPKGGKNASTAPGNSATGNMDNVGSNLGLSMPSTILTSPAAFNIGLGPAPDALSLPQFWADVFNIPLAPNTPTSMPFWASMPQSDTMPIGMDP